MNPVTGEKRVTIGDSDYVLRFPWRALSEIEHKYGENPNFFDPAIVADIGAIGFRDKHPEMTAERILEISPPLMPFAQAIQTAIQWAYFGKELIPDSDDEPVKKKETGFWKRIGMLLCSVFRRSTSGV